ncbi:hypothetical protein [Aeromonas sobria]|uniref:hypothetical protein n=1 Tax=Aeromonas sobria TaxID=646 RepID=UPI000C6DFC6B|nr:hypothetical protein [Aeromonas sobria]PKQ78090.1 hypothetical protein CJF47_07360 [Aeromonas sobria]
MWVSPIIQEQFKIADRFKWSLDTVQSLSYPEHLACCEYIRQHPIDEALHFMLGRIGTYVAQSNGADIKLQDLFPDSIHDKMPKELMTPEELNPVVPMSDEEADRIKAESILEQKKAFYAIHGLDMPPKKEE